MAKLFLFEIEANGKPILNFGEWEQSYTEDLGLAQNDEVAAYGEIEDGRYIELYEK